MSRNLKDAAHREMHGRLLNWGAWAADPSREHHGQEAHALEVVEADAAEMEIALLVLRRARPQLWEYTRRAYLYRWQDISIAEEMRIGDTGLRTVRWRLYEWLAAFFEGQRLRDTLAAGQARRASHAESDSDMPSAGERAGACG